MHRAQSQPLRARARERREERSRIDPAAQGNTDRHLRKPGQQPSQALEQPLGAEGPAHPPAGAGAVVRPFPGLAPSGRAPRTLLVRPRRFIHGALSLNTPKEPIRRARASSSASREIACS